MHGGDEARALGRLGVGIRPPALTVALSRRLDLVEAGKAVLTAAMVSPSSMSFIGIA